MPAGSGCGGCAIVLVVISIVGYVGWIGATTLFHGAPSSQGLITPKVFDDARLLSPGAIRLVEGIPFPSDVAVIVRTVQSLDATAPGPAATDFMQREPHWQTVGPRTWHLRQIRRDPPWSRAVYLLVSRGNLY